MKLIHMPTGKIYDATEPAAKGFEKSPSNIFIRAELPEYWRVEGYDNSWEWANALNARKLHRDYDFVSNVPHSEGKADAFQESDKEGMQLPQISKAEFEHHIYNPWKAKQSNEFNPQWDFNSPHEQINTTFVHKGETFTAKIQQCQSGEWIGHVNEAKGAMSQAENKDKLIENLKKAIDTIRAAKQLDMSDVDKLREAAEKMGYELVRKIRKPVDWELGENTYRLDESGVNVKDQLDGQSVWIENIEIETLIEKYNQFKSNS